MTKKPGAVVWCVDACGGARTHRFFFFFFGALLFSAQGAGLRICARLAGHRAHTHTFVLFLRVAALKLVARITLWHCRRRH